MKPLLAFLLLLSGAQGQKLAIELSPPGKIKQGELVIADDDKCTRDAVASLETSCGRLGDDQIGKFAVHLMNCRAAKEGRAPVRCETQMTIKECTNERVMDQVTYNTYMHFKNQALTVCQLVQNDIWLQSTEAAVAMLHHATHDQLEVFDHIKKNQAQLSENTERAIRTVVEGQETILRKQDVLQQTSDGIDQKVLQALQNQKALTEKQEVSLKNQDVLIERSHSLSASLENTEGNIRAINDEMDRQSNHYNSTYFALLSAVEAISEWQHFLVSQWLDVQTVVFYVAAVIFSVALTSSPKTAAARFWMLLCVVICLVLERTLVQMPGVSGDAILYRITLCRRLFMAVSVILLGLSIWLHRDYIFVSWGLLKDIKVQNEKILEEIRRFSISPPSVIQSKKIAVAETQTDPWDVLTRDPATPVRNFFLGFTLQKEQTESEEDADSDYKDDDDSYSSSSSSIESDEEIEEEEDKDEEEQLVEAVPVPIGTPVGGYNLRPRNNRPSTAQTDRSILNNSRV